MTMLWLFQRRRDIEMEAGLVLAGQTIFDAPDDQKISRKAKRQIKQAIGVLAWLARSGRLADFAVVARWLDEPPSNASEFLDDDDMLGRWVADRYSIIVRVAPPGSGKIPVDSDLLRQMGFRPALD
jgi:hypothetical protein